MLINIKMIESRLHRYRSVSTFLLFIIVNIHFWRKSLSFYCHNWPSFSYLILFILILYQLQIIRWIESWFHWHTHSQFNIIVSTRLLSKIYTIVHDPISHRRLLKPKTLTTLKWSSVKLLPILPLRSKTLRRGGNRGREEPPLQVFIHRSGGRGGGIRNAN